MSAQGKRSIDQIEKDIETSRVRLAATIDELSYRVKPANLAKRQVASAKSALHQVTHTPGGALRYDVVGGAAAVVLTLVTIAVVRRVRG